MASGGRLNPEEVQRVLFLESQLFGETLSDCQKQPIAGGAKSSTTVMAQPHTRAENSALRESALSNQVSHARDNSDIADLEETTTTSIKETSGTTTLKTPPISLKITREKHTRSSSLSATESSPTKEPDATLDCQRVSRSRSESRGRRSLRCTHFGCKFSTTVSQEFTHHQNTAHTEERDREALTRETTTSTATTTTTQRRSSARHTKRASSTSTPVAETATKTPPPPPPPKNAKLTPPPKKSESPLSNKKKLPPNDETDSVASAEGDSTSSSVFITAQTEEEESATQALLSLKSPEFSPPAKSPATNSSTPQEVTESATAVPLTSDPSNMISNSRGAAQPVETFLSGASEDENDMSEDGRLIIDDAGISSGGATGPGSTVVPTRCGNIQNRTYMCDECTYTTNSAQQSLRHQKEEHGHDFIIYECDICDYATRYKQKLPRHYKLHFPGGGPSSTTPYDSQNSDTSLSPRPSIPMSAIPTATSTPVPNVSAVAPAPFPTAATPITGAATPPGNKRSAAEAGFVALNTLPSEVILEDGEDEELDDEEDGVSPPPEGAEGGDEMAVMMSAAPPAKKKRKDVSPDKYFEVAEEVASTKYGCAKCGNVYKWKKSLNKHWKEKHGSDPGDQSSTPPGMEILLQQNNHTQTEHRRCCHNNLLERITVKQTSSRAATPQNFLNGHYSSNSSSMHQHGGPEEDEMDGASPGYIPAGPFVSGTSQPVFPGNASVRQNFIKSLNAPIRSSANVLDLSTHPSSTPNPNMDTNSGDGIDEPDSVDPDDAANVPLDFSVQRGSNGRLAAATPPHGMASLFHHQHQEATAEEDEEVIALDQMARGSVPSKDILKCPKCGEVLKTQTAYSNHMAMHLHSSNKRVAKCGVCCKHFPNNDQLNTHFMENHIDLIASHKEAIQKIPHGLQQTYHLLKMPIQNISKISSTEAEDPLKCNMCDFTAKWPAELQKHAVSHSDERPFVCMVCGSTYKWKWDLVKHFEKAHSNLPNPYKRRDNGNISGSQSANSELQASGVMASGSQDSYEMEEGEIAPTQIKMPSMNGNSVDYSNSFLFDNGSSQDDISVENILRTTDEASRMMRSQPNFLDGPDEDPQRSSSCSPTPHSDREGLQISDVRSLHGMAIPTAHDLQQHSRAGPVRQALAKNIRGRQVGPGHPYLARGAKTGKGAYKGYKTVENSESSDLKYQCVLCDYKARWPSEIMQHMKNHSSEKPYGCPNCSYRSKWKWDVVKHLKRCGGGTIKDVLDYTSKPVARDAPPNVMVTPEGSLVQTQQVVSPNTSTSAADDSSTSSVALPGVVPSNNSQPPSSFLPSPFLVSVPTAAAAAASAYNNAQAMVNAHLLLQRFQAANEASGSAPVTTESSDQSQSPLPSSPPGSSSQEESTEHIQQDQKRQQQHAHHSAPVVFNSLINEGQHHCLLCMFVANSPAELRRHQVLHSDEKPFMCDECGYCTKWKCDMKKHKEKYKHTGPIKYTRPSSNTDTSTTQDSSKSDDCKCHLCPFEASSKDALQTHIKKFHPDRASTSSSSSSSSSSGKKSPSRRKFMCKTCPFGTNELGDWVNHLRKHKGEGGSEESRQSPTPNGAPEMDEARLKHPRKAVKKYVCPKCDFVCVKSTELLEHQKQAHGTHRCPFCNQSFDKKDTFLEHLITHPEFNPKEWEHFFMVGSDNEDDENNNNNRSQSDSRQEASTSDMGSSANTISFTPSSSSRRNSPVPVAPDNNLRSQPAPDSGLPCDWCKARFPTALSLIEHAMITHPNQMRGQEPAAETKSSPFSHRDSQTSVMADKSKSHPGKKGSRTPTPPTKPNGQLASGMDWSSILASGTLNAPTLVAQLGQPKVIVPSQQHPATSASPSSSSSSSTKQEMVLNLSKNIGALDPAAALMCTKCSFKTRDVAKLQQHFQEHVAAEKQLAQMRQQSRNKEQLRCWFCSVKVASHLEQFQHMDEKHPELFKQHQTQKDALVQKIVLEMNTLGKQMAATGQRVKPATTKSQAAKATSPFPALPHAAQQQPRAASHAALEQEAVSSLLQAGKVPGTWLHERKVTTYNGLPVTLVNNGKEQWYKCVMCSVTYSSPDQVCTHTYKVHRDLPRRYQCNHCTESADQLQQLLKHQQMVHPDMLPDITVLTYEEINQAADSTPSATTSSGRYSCKDCDMTFTSKQSLESHVLVKHGEQSYVCGYCPFTSGFSDMMEHSKIHSDLKLAYQPKASSKTAPLSIPAIKQEPMSFSPPDASTPVHDTFDSTPLDLSAEPDHYPDKGRSRKEVLPPVKKSGSLGVEKMEVDHENTATAEEKSVQQTAVVGKKEPEVKEVKAKTSKVAEAAGSAGHGEKPTRVYKCKHCPFSSSSNFEFRTHCSFHGLSGQHPCDYCTYSHQELDNLLHHRELHADEPGFSPDYKPPQPAAKSPEPQQEDEAAGCVSPAPEPLYCPDCPYKTTCSSTLGQHMACHGHRLPFICDFCDFSADQQAEVSQHRLLHNDEPDFMATVDDDALLNPEYPKDHVSGEFESKLSDSRLSTEEAASEAVPCDAQSPPKLTLTKKLYSCTLCSFVTGNRGAFDFHQSLHGGSGCYPCEQCSYHTGRWSLLLQHGRLHDQQAAGSAPSPTHQDDSGEGTHTSPSSSSSSSKTGKTALAEKHGDDSSCKGEEDSPNKDVASCASSSSASDYGSLTNGDSGNNKISGSSDTEEHAKHHSGSGQVVCPCCDYACASKEELLTHIQVHFTSTVVDMDALSRMLANAEKKTDAAGTASNLPKSSNPKSSPGKASEVQGEKSSEDKSKACGAGSGEIKTKVYVCHFCDDEFDNKDLMLKHESQCRGQAAC